MIKLFHIPNRWQSAITLILDILLPIFFIISSFLVSTIPIQVFFPTHSTPDAPLIVLFCLLLHKYSNYFIPVFFLCVAMFEYVFMMPTASLFLHYGFFIILGYSTWNHFLNSEISFRLVYFYFSLLYLFTLIWDVVLFSFLYKGYLGFYDAFLFWISNIMLFPALFFILYYLMLRTKTINRVNHV
ncbi:MAG: hypothetical protein ACJARD_000317 [Alphaproteobacteria bacterium]|jgi:hypothetical protein